MKYFPNNNFFGYIYQFFYTLIFQSCNKLQTLYASIKYIVKFEKLLKSNHFKEKLNECKTFIIP